LLFGISGVNGDIPNTGTYRNRTCYWEGPWFEDKSITHNKLHAVTDNIQRIMIECLQIRPFICCLTGSWILL
jgi:hypothetical protein